MLYYWLHLMYLYLGSRFFWKKVSIEDDLSRTRRVNILDCDALNYMANSKYFYYMDFIRYEVLLRSKLYDTTFKKGMFPVIGSQKFIYKKPLKRWSKFTITLILEGWDDKWVYHRQVFKRKGEVYAIGFTKVAFWKYRRAQDMRKIIAASGALHKEMDPPTTILRLFESDYSIIKST